MTNDCPAGTPWCEDHAVDLGGMCLGEPMRYPGGIALWLQKPPGEAAEIVYNCAGFTRTFPLHEV